MEAELSDAQIDQIVRRQLQKLDDEYEEVHRHDAAELQSPQSNRNIDQLMREAEPEDGPDVEGAEEDGDYVPYQQIGDNGDAGLFEDDGQQTSLQPTSEEAGIEGRLEEAPPLSFQLADEAPQALPLEAPAPASPEQPMDAEKIKSIALRFELRPPQWAADPVKCEARLRQLFRL